MATGGTKFSERGTAYTPNDSFYKVTSINDKIEQLPISKTQGKGFE